MNYWNKLSSHFLLKYHLFAYYLISPVVRLYLWSSCSPLVGFFPFKICVWCPCEITVIVNTMHTNNDAFANLVTAFQNAIHWHSCTFCLSSITGYSVSMKMNMKWVNVCTAAAMLHNELVYYLLGSTQQVFSFEELM